jgi:hypothetical protein
LLLHNTPRSDSALTARIALRLRDSLSDGELTVLRGKLAKLDASAAGGPWTRRVLELIRDNPAVRAGDICKVVQMERLPFKANVRKLKALGLTESLEVGYRLSPRGEALLSSFDTAAVHDELSHP